VHATPTKEGRPAIGLDAVRHAAATARAPWFAIGGLDADTVPAVLDAGATRIVVVRADRRGRGSPAPPPGACATWWTAA
jgi:thiamine-phosphate pyrophosphorylase